jgi:hypothetical protein
MNDDGVKAIAELAANAAEAEELDLGSYYVVHGSDGNVHKIDLTGDQYRDNPKRVTGTVQLTHVGSLLEVWGKHNDPDSDVYADREARTITAVFNAHRGRFITPPTVDGDFVGVAHRDAERARWQDHRALLTLTYSDALKAWLGSNGRAMNQEQFAEFIEDRIANIIEPAGADLLEMAQTFQAHTTAEFKSGINIQNGQRTLTYIENIDGRVSDGTASVPTGLTLHLPVWRGDDSDLIDMTARIRYRVGGGKLSLSYHLDQPTEVLDAAFEAEIARVEGHVGRHVLRGTPAR